MSDLATTLAEAGALSALGRHEQALQLLMGHARTARQDPAWLTALARTQYRLDRLWEAARTADEALRLAPHSVELLCLRGAIELAYGHASKALDYAERAIAAEPRNPRGHELLAHERIFRLQHPRDYPYLSPKRVEEAIDTAERLGADPKQIAMLRARMWSIRWRPGRARKHIDAALARTPMDRELRRTRATRAEGDIEAVELLWGLLAEAPMDVEAQDELAIRYLRRLQPQALSVLAVFAAASVLLMLPPTAAALCALGGAVLLPWRFLRRRRRTLLFLARRGHDEALRTAPGLRAGGALMLAAALSALLPLAAAPFLPETGDVRLLAWITAASAVTGACLAWLAERLNRRGIRRFLTGPGNSRAQDTAELHRPRLTGYFFGQTVASCLSAMLAAFLGATLSQDITPGLGMLALFAAPYAWLCLWPVIGMQLRDWRRQAAGGRATLSLPAHQTTTAGRPPLPAPERPDRALRGAPAHHRLRLPLRGRPRLLPLSRSTAACAGACARPPLLPLLPPGRCLAVSVGRAERRRPR